MVQDNKRMKITFIWFAIFMCFILALILVLTSSFSEEKSNLPVGVDCSIHYTTLNTRFSSLDLKNRDSTWQQYNWTMVDKPTKFGYVWITLRNATSESYDFILINGVRNYYTELLKPVSYGAVTLYRHGDTVPISASPIRNHKTSFPVSVPAKRTVELIMEIEGSSGVSIQPIIMQQKQWFSFVVLDRNLAAMMIGTMSCFILLYLFSGLILKSKYHLSIAFFVLTELFYFLRRSRILMLILPIAYPPWLFPLTVYLNILSSVFLAFTVAQNIRPLWRKFLLFILSLATITVVIGFFTSATTIASILNSFAVGVLTVFILSVLPSFKNRDYETIFICISFIPVLLIIFVDVFSDLFKNINSRYSEYRQPLSIVAMLILLSIMRDFFAVNRLDTKVQTLTKELEASKAETVKQISKFNNISKNTSLQFFHQIQQPLEGINAAVMILKKTNNDPRVHAASNIIANEVKEVKQIFETEIEHSKSFTDEFSEKVTDFQIFQSQEVRNVIHSGQIAIFDTDIKNANRTKLILQAEGYFAEVYTSKYTVLSEIEKNNVDILIIDPTVNGDDAFSLCLHVRETRNVLSFPILMITNYYAAYLMQKSYSAGVNDFLTRPFDSSELITRVYSLLKLKEVYEQNLDLAESEKEKKTFLYFLTHNINTPLTLLLNQIQELSEICEDEKALNTIDDLKISASEISDIVQNVLVSFRLSDGRHTIMIEEVDVAIIIQYLKNSFQQRLELKQQLIQWNLPEEIPFVRGDRNSIKGILYNLIDNAIKFSPYGVTITFNCEIKSTSLELSVSDTGCGISPEDQKKLFGRFEKLNSKPTGGESSTGLGLYVAHELAIMNGGSLTYQEVSPRGSSFVLTVERI